MLWLGARPVVGLFGTFGTPEMAVLLGIALLLFGAKRLPEMGRSIGQGLREFKKSLSGVADESEDSDADRKTPQ